MREGILVLLPKEGSNDLCGITLLDMVYKLIFSVVNTRTGNEGNHLP
jgi:hypothetical protein